MKTMLSLLLFGTFLCGSSFSEVKLPAVFSDNMVIQQGASWNIWGTAAPGEKVTVVVGDQKQTAVTDADGKWKAVMPPVKEDKPFEITVSGDNTVTIRNVLAGEVWLASGQSNMAMEVKMAQNLNAEKEAATHPSIRMFTVKNVFLLDRPADDVEGQWVVCSPETVAGFSATGYFFARDLQANLNVPVGIINSSWGGKRIEYFMNPVTVTAQSDLQDVRDAFTSMKKIHTAMTEKYDAAVKAGDTSVRQPAPWMNYGSIYNGMIAPLIPYTIKGVVWYQGENNSAFAYQYRHLFPEMIRQWRHDWGEGDFPFLFVQLAGWAPTPAADALNNWPDLREAQMRTLSVTNTGMAITIDIGLKDNIHPTNKQEVGRRLALAAEAVAYGQKLVYSGPIYDSMSIEWNKIRVHFKHTGSGLIAKGGELTAFAIAGGDQKFVPARAVIDGDTVIVSSPDVSAPVAVSYGWRQFPACNLYNSEGLPASPFRTDDWKRTTQR